MSDVPHHEPFLEASDRQIWVRAFYGFDPETAGYIGFTNPGDQKTMLDQMRDGDLVLIYGAVESITEQDLRAQALGFLEIKRTPATDRQRMSDDAYAWKVQHGFQERWTHGLIVTRAWRIRNRVGIGTIAPEAYQSKNRFGRTTRALLLTEAEKGRALSHPVRQVNVFGEPAIPEDLLTNGPMSSALKPSKGISPQFGQRTSEYADGDNFVYLMKYSAPGPDFLRPGECGRSDSVVKVGRSNDPKERLKSINCGFPQATMHRWAVAQSYKFSDGQTAHDHEDILKTIFENEFKSQGNEFYSGDLKSMESRFRNYCLDVLPKILGAPGKASGIR